MLRYLLVLLPSSYARRGADRMIKTNGVNALFAARRAVESARERSRTNYWTRLLAEVESRSSYRPW